MTYFQWLTFYSLLLGGPPPPEDNGLNAPSLNPMSQHPVTSVVTTGPDGSNIDEASQQSTISNASAGAAHTHTFRRPIEYTDAND